MRQLAAVLLVSLVLVVPAAAGGQEAAEVPPGADLSATEFTTTPEVTTSTTAPANVAQAAGGGVMAVAFSGGTVDVLSGDPVRVDVGTPSPAAAGGDTFSDGPSGTTPEPNTQDRTTTGAGDGTPPPTVDGMTTVPPEAGRERSGSAPSVTTGPGEELGAPVRLAERSGFWLPRAVPLVALLLGLVMLVAPSFGRTPRLEAR